MRAPSLVRVSVIGLQILASAILAHALVLAPAAQASEQEDGTSARWIPGASFYTGGLPGERKARFSSEVTTSKEGDSVGFPWSVGFSAELASPEIRVKGLGSPRLFAHADVGYAFDPEDPIVNQGDPGSPPEVTGPPFTVNTIENIGATVRAEAQPLVLSAGTGVLFRFEPWDRVIYLRPSIEWMYQRDRIRAFLGAGENELAGQNACGPCRTLYIDAQTEKGFHSVGPGIDLEIEAARAGDFLVGVYTSFRALAIVGDRKADLNPVGQWERTDGQPTTRADTTLFTRYERETWHYRFGVGIRFSWLPE